MDNRTLRTENLQFAGTAGVSENNSALGFKPAFLHRETGQIEIARMSNGQPAPVHIISWLPAEWATSFNEDGTVKSISPQIIAGFVCNNDFYTREQLAEL